MHSSVSLYQEYPCSCNAPLNCDRPWQTAQEIRGAKFCLECGFPAILPLEVEIKGSRGSYQVKNFIGVRGNGRLYSGIQLQDKQPVVIKEYLLPNRCFNPEETSEQKETFKRVGGVKLADGRIENFRVVNTWEAITDEKGERCYLITKETEEYQTLGQYLMSKGAMTASGVREVLNQALQTLQLLHTQKLVFPANQVKQGLTHGNINLESVLIKEENNQQFDIFLCDLAIWENIFIPPAIPSPKRSKPEQDLESLGQIAFYLWVGRTTNSSGEPLDPRDPQEWPNTDNNLKQFLYRLIGLGIPFESAKVAHQALLQLPIETDDENFQHDVATLPPERHFYTPLILLGMLALLLVGGGIWYYFWLVNPTNENTFSNPRLFVKNEKSDIL